MTKAEQELHQSHHHAGADCHSELAEHFRLTDPVAHKCHKALAEDHLRMHKNLGELPTEEIQSHSGTSDDVKALVSSVDELRKTIANSIIPTTISAIPTQTRPTIIPRTGQQHPDIAKVDESLRRLVVDESEARQ